MARFSLSAVSHLAPRLVEEVGVRTASVPVALLTYNCSRASNSLFCDSHGKCFLCTPWCSPVFPLFNLRRPRDFKLPISRRRNKSYPYNIQGGLRRGGPTPACGFAHARIGEERYGIIIGKAEAAQKRLFGQGVYFNSKERSFAQVAMKIDGKYCSCMKNTSGARCTMTNGSSSNSSNIRIYTCTHTAADSHTWYVFIVPK